VASRRQFCETYNPCYRLGYDARGYCGFDKDGYDHQGYDRCGYGRDGYTRYGYDRDGNDKLATEGKRRGQAKRHDR
jgi:hypothetical protein